MKNLLLKILIIALTISAVLGIIIVVFNIDSDVAEKTLLTSLVVFAFSIPELCCSTIFEKNHKKPLAVAGMITSLFSLIYFLLIVWEIIAIDNILEFTVLLPIMSASFAHISLVSLINPKNNSIKLMQTATIILSVIMDIIIFPAIAYNIEAPAEMFATLAILIALGTLTTPIANKIANAPEKSPENNLIPTTTENNAVAQPTPVASNEAFTKQATENTYTATAPVFTLGKKLYTMSLDLKRTPKINLNSNSGRTELLKTINNIQAVVCKMNKELLQAQTHSSEYYELIVYMSEILCNCTSLLLNKDGDYKSTVTSYLMGFHNLSRAFLPLDDDMKVSVAKAKAYFESYC